MKNPIKVSVSCQCKLMRFFPAPEARTIAIQILVFITITVYGAAMADERDPFQPYTWSAPSAADTKEIDKESAYTNPLTNKPLSAYTVIGVAISPTDALAVLKSRDKHEYFAYVGDRIGSEGGILKVISTEGITIDIGGKIVPLKISNRFEAQDEKLQDEKK